MRSLGYVSVYSKDKLDKGFFSTDLKTYFSFYTILDVSNPGAISQDH